MQRFDMIQPPRGNLGPPGMGGPPVSSAFEVKHLVFILIAVTCCMLI
jgi:hypothetical protein